MFWFVAFPKQHPGKILIFLCHNNAQFFPFLVYMPNSFKFSRSLASVLATVALVSSALTGLLYSSPVQAVYDTSTTPSTTQDVVTSNKVQPVFTYSLSLLSGEVKTPLRLSFKTTQQDSLNLKPGVIAPIGTKPVSSSDCKVTVNYTRASDSSAASKTFNDCSVLTDTTTGNFNATPTDLPSQEFTDVKADTKITVTFDTKVLSEPASTDVDVQFVPQLTNSDGTAIQFLPAKYNLKLGGIEIKKTRVTQLDGSYIGAQLPISPYSDSIFEIVITNKNNFGIYNLDLKDYLNPTADSYYGNCSFGASASNNIGVTFAPYAFASLPASPLETVDSGQTVPAKTTAGDGKFAVYVGCDRTSNLPANPGTLTNYAKIKNGRLGSNDGPQISDSTVSGYDLGDSSADLRAQANFAGGADLSLKKEVVSNGLGSNASGDVTYRITVKNESTTNASEKVLFGDYFQSPSQGTATIKGTASTGTVVINHDSDIDGSETGSVIPDIQSAFTGGKDVQNQGLYFTIDKLSPSEYIQFTYTVTYGISSTDCSITDSAKIIRNTALISPSSTVVYTPATSIPLDPTNVEDVVISGAGLYGDLSTKVADYDPTNNTSVTIYDTYLYSDPNQNNNFASADISPDLCKPDLQLVSKNKSTSPTSTAGIGEEVEYTVVYKNYAAKVATGAPNAGQIRSGAKNILLEDQLATGVTFGKIVSPDTAKATVSGNILTIASLPDLKIGDENEQTVRYTVIMPAGKENAGKEIKNIVSVKVNNELSGYEWYKEDLGTILNATGNASGVASNFAKVDSVGNNSYKNTLTLIGGPDVQVLKTVDIGEGQLKTDTTALTYTVKVKNIGTEVANSVMVRDTLPTCTTFGTKVSGPDGTLTSDSRNIDYNLGNLSIDQEVVVVFKANVAQNDACKINNSTVIQNSATATISSLQKDLNVANNTGIANSSVVALNQNAALTKTVDQLVAQPGATLTYTITLKGQGAQFKGSLVDELPANVTFVNADPAAVKDGNKLTWSNVTVDSGKALVATVKVTVNSDANGTTVNKVTATTADGKVNFAQAVTSIEVAGNAKVTGYIYFDANRNQKEDKLERASTYADYLKNIRVVAVASNGKEYSAVTNDSGAFMIDKLPAGKYTVKVDINTVKGSYKNVQLNVAAVEPSADGLTRMADVRANESFDLTAGFRLFTGQTSTGANTQNGVATISGLIALLSFSFLATLSYSELRKKALSL